MSVIFLGIVGFLGTILYERFSTTDVFDQPVESVEGVEGPEVRVAYSYPARVELKSADGRVMMATLLARSGTHIQITRDDAETFVYPITSLDLKTQSVVGKYPNLGIKNAVEYMDQGSMDVGDLYVQELEKRIRQIDGEVTRLFQDFEGSGSRVERRTIQRKVEELREERVELERDISDRK